MTTSIDNTREEIGRFLTGSEPSVLCITGEWGVGKTFVWREILNRMRKDGKLELTRYSYVSLFGLGSLEDVKASLFENMEWLDKDATNFGEWGKIGAKAIAARAKKLSELAGALPVIGQAITKARPLYFSAIHNQIVCIDDLERRSKNLDLKDVLGLISFLREQRGCKAVLLLNAAKLGDASNEFYRLLEKVVEARAVLAPTAAESARIALPGTDAISVAVRKHSETLGIRNIRIIKQVDRLVRRVSELLTEFPQAIQDQAVHSTTLFGWAKYDSEGAPKMEFLKESALERHLNRGGSADPPPAEEVAWDSLLVKYNFNRVDDFDFTLMNYVDSMILDVGEIKKQARALQENNRIGALHGTFESAWRLFHDSFEDNEDQVVSELVSRTKEAHEVVSLPNLNETVVVLRTLGRETEADDLINFFINTCDRTYWVTEDPFGRGPFETRINSIVDTLKSVPPPTPDFEAELIRAGKDFDRDTIAKLAALPVEAYHDLVAKARDEKLRAVALSALEFRRISNATDDMKRVVKLMEEALRMLARSSKLNALRAKKYGVSVSK